jgi:hypothetical protein
MPMRGGTITRGRRNVYAAKPGLIRAAPSHFGAEFYPRVKRRSWAIQLIVSIGCLLARSGPIFKGRLGNAVLFWISRESQERTFSEDVIRNLQKPPSSEVCWDSSSHKRINI